jgi:hypothetical protein
MFIQRTIDRLSDMEFAALAIILGFKESYYERVFDFDFRPDRIKEKYRLTYKEFLIHKKKLQSLGLTTKDRETRKKIREAWISRINIKNALPSQVHMWAIDY